MAIRIPDTLVFLGGAIELDAGDNRWVWKPSEKWVVASSEQGNRIYIFPRRKPNPGRAEVLYQKFNRRKADKTEVYDIGNPRVRAGRANHIVYRSPKFGKMSSYIHTFDNQPVIWVDKKKNPRILVLQGGKIRVTKRGIEG